MDLKISVKHTPDDVVRIQNQIDEYQQMLEDLKSLRNKLVQGLVDDGVELVSSEGHIIVYDPPREVRSVLPEMVKVLYPEKYQAIAKAQMERFEPKITLGVLQSYFEDDEIARVVSKTPRAASVYIKKNTGGKK